MSTSSRRAMAEAVAKAQAEGDFVRSGPSSLDTDQKRHDKMVKQFFEQIEVYRDASPFVAQLWKKSRKKRKWEPTDEELALFFATIREVKRRAKRGESIHDLFIYEEGLDLPSSLDPDSFDLLD